MTFAQAMIVAIVLGILIIPFLGDFFQYLWQPGFWSSLSFERVLVLIWLGNMAFLVASFVICVTSKNEFYE